jgi:hypothetical protein
MKLSRTCVLFYFAQIDLLIRSAYVLDKHNGKLVGRFILR